MKKRWPAAEFIDSLSPGTAPMYRTRIEFAAAHFGGEHLDAIDWAAIRPAELRAYLVGLAKRQRPSTVRSTAIALTSFYHWLEMEELIPADQLARVRQATRIGEDRDKMQRRRRALFDAEISAISAINLGTPRRRAQIAAFWTQLSTGVRGQELCDLNTADFDAETGETVVRSGKGRKERVVWIPEHARVLLASHRADIENPTYEWVARTEDVDRLLVAFVEKGEDRSLARGADRAGVQLMIRGLSVRRLNYGYEELARAAGIPRFSSHVLRYTAASRMFDLGTDVFTVSRIFGHAKLETTFIYDRRPGAEKEAALAKLANAFIQGGYIPHEGARRVQN